MKANVLEQEDFYCVEWGEYVTEACHEDCGCAQRIFVESRKIRTDGFVAWINHQCRHPGRISNG